MAQGCSLKRVPLFEDRMWQMVRVLKSKWLIFTDLVENSMWFEFKGNVNSMNINKIGQSKMFQTKKSYFW